MKAQVPGKPRLLSPTNAKPGDSPFPDIKSRKVWETIFSSHRKIYEKFQNHLQWPGIIALNRKWTKMHLHPWYTCCLWKDFSLDLWLYFKRFRSRLWKKTSDRYKWIEKEENTCCSSVCRVIPNRTYFWNGHHEVDEKTQNTNIF